jgi:predicted amidohydrolase
MRVNAKTKSCVCYTVSFRLCHLLMACCVMFSSAHFMANAHGQEKIIKIAMAQIFCLDGDRSGNFARLENAVSEAKEKGAEIVCLPETAIFGWVNPDAHKRACPIPGEDSARLCQLAKKHNVFLCVGLAEKENDKLYDSVILIDNEGKILLKHRKINILTELMTPPYTAGKGMQVVKTKYGKIGLLICADSFKEEILSQMAELKPDIVLIPYGWAAAETAWPQHGEQLIKTVQNAAKKMNCVVIGTDLIGRISHGPWTGLVFGGASVAADKNGEILGLGKDRDKDIVWVTVKTPCHEL